MFRTVPVSTIRSFSLYTQQWCMLYRIRKDPSWSCSQGVSKTVWHTPLLCVQWKTPDDGQRNCPKHVEFYSKNEFEKLVHLVGFIIRIQIYYKHRLLRVLDPTTPSPASTQLHKQMFKFPFTACNRTAGSSVACSKWKSSETVVYICVVVDDGPVRSKTCRSWCFIIRIIFNSCVVHLLLFYAQLCNWKFVN